MNREKFKQAIPVHDQLVNVENQIGELKQVRNKIDAQLAELTQKVTEINDEIALLDTQRIAIYEEFKAI